MKKVLLMTTMLLTLTMGLSAAQKQTAQESQELVDSVNKAEIELFSDTTAVDSLEEQVTASDYRPMSTLDRLLERTGDKGVLGMLFVLGVLLILFVLSPVLIIIALFYFINKNRKDKMKLAQMAMQSGQPIPDHLLEGKPSDVSDEFQTGMRQCFVGVGLMIFLGFAAGNVGFGIGALVFCIGLGKVFSGKMADWKKDKDNDLNIQNYD